MKRKNTTFDYSLAIRYKDLDGNWSEWQEYGEGIFQNIETIHRQMRVILAPYERYKDKQIKFLKNGNLCDKMGNITDKFISV